MPTAAEAAEFVSPYGRYEGITLAKIAETDEGLKWLDWFRGTRVMTATGRQALVHVEAYLDDPDLCERIEAVHDEETASREA